MELTITQNGALYFVHHKVPKRRAALLWPFRTAASKQDPDIRGLQGSKAATLSRLIERWKTDIDGDIAAAVRPAILAPMVRLRV